MYWVLFRKAVQHGIILSFSTVYSRIMPAFRNFYYSGNYAATSLTLSTWKVRLDEMVKCGQENTMLSSTYPIHGSASEVNCSDADRQVIFCNHYLVVFYLSSYISGLVL